MAEREGFRTPDTVARMPHFECGAFNHSATSPNHCIDGGFSFCRVGATPPMVTKMVANLFISCVRLSQVERPRRASPQHRPALCR